MRRFASSLFTFASATAMLVISSTAVSQSQQEITKGGNTDNVLTYGMSYNQHRFSPLTWTQNGKQYVSVLAGLGGLYGTTSRARLPNVPLGGSVWTFALRD